MLGHGGGIECRHRDGVAVWLTGAALPTLHPVRRAAANQVLDTEFETDGDGEMMVAAGIRLRGDCFLEWGETVEGKGGKPAAQVGWLCGLWARCTRPPGSRRIGIFQGEAPVC